MVPDMIVRCKTSESKEHLHNPTLILQRAWALFILLIVVSGCATYHPMPMTSEAVNARLQAPDMSRICVLAGEIDHPILHPVELKPDEGLSPDGAAVLAVLLNPSLRAIRDQRAVSSAQLLQASLLPNPVLSASVGVPMRGDTAGRVTAYGLGLDWDVTSLISRASRIDAAKARDEMVDLSIAWREWQVAQATKAAVYELQSLQEQIVLLAQARRAMAEILARVGKSYAEGSMTIIDLHSAQTASRRADESLLDLEKQADRQRLQLARLLGLPPGTQLRLSRDISLPPRVETPTDTALFDRLEQRRLDLLALRRGYDSQEAKVREAVLEQFPKISIGPTTDRDTDNVHAIGFGLNIELPIFDRRQGRIAHERATREKLFDEYVNRVFEARSDIERIISDIRFMNEQIAAAQAAEAELARLDQDYHTALVDGRMDAPSYYTVLAEYVNAQTKVCALQGQLAQAVVALEMATGLYEIPEPGPPQTSRQTEHERGSNP
jgi:cobalt-zinc-cadmium efflux system outer membrane protein